MPEGNQRILRMVAVGLAKRPAYLLLFGLGVIGGGVSGSMGFFGDEYFQVFSVGAFFLFLLIAALSVVRVEYNLRPQFIGVIPDVEARQEFLSGPNGARMSGAWTLTWNWMTGKDEDDISLTVSGASVFGVAFDDEHSKSYWFLARIDDDGDMPAIFWGKDGMGPVGIVILKRVNSNVFEGRWYGDNKDDKSSDCRMTFERKV